MLFYKNEINGELAGLTTSPYPLNIENFFEVTEEEYLSLGGILPQQPASAEEPVESAQPSTDAGSLLVNALVG